jgi:predicted DCC family thiol-disulfide oxidoreductase YuxK
MKSLSPETSPLPPGQWTPWQTTLYCAALSTALLLWSVLPSEGSIAARCSIAVLGLFLPIAHSKTWQRSLAGLAIVILIATFVPTRSAPQPPMLAALAFLILTPRATPVPQLFALAAIGASLTMSPPSQWPWILIALPVLIPPSCVPGISPSTQERLFYDGHCGLCHHAVQFLLAEDHDGSRFRYAPLDSGVFRNTIPEVTRQALPDSVVVWIPEPGTALTRSAAALHAMRRLGGYWRALAAVASLIPGSVLDTAYDAIARVRKRIFASPQEACPLIPRELRSRFDL